MPTPNFIKYSTTPDDKSIKVGNYSIGVASGTTYGPTSGTSYWSGISPPTSGYTIYENKVTNGPSIRVPSSSAVLIDYVNRLYSGSSITTEAGALTYFNSLNTVICVNRDYEEIVTVGLILLLDAGFSPSYPKSGTSWTDLSFSGNNGTLTNGPTFNSSNGGSIVFDGVDDYVEVSHNTILNPSLNMTLSSWIKITTFVSRMSIFGKGTTSSGFGGFDFRIDCCEINNPMQLNLVKYGIVDQRVPISTLSTNTWYNISAVQSSTKVDYYINGLSVGSFSNSTAYQTNTGSLRIGRDRNVIYTPASISNILYYNRELSAAEILQNFNAQKARFGL